MKERRALQNKLKEMEAESMQNGGVKSNGTSNNSSSNGVHGLNGINGNGSLNQYYDSVNHNHINNKKNIEYTDKYSYSNGNENANGTMELINRKK